MSIIATSKKHADLTFEIETELLEQEKINDLWEIYEGACLAMEPFSPQKQFYQFIEFQSLMKNIRVSKFILKQNGKIHGLIMFTNQLSLCDWISIPYFETKYASAVKADKIFLNICFVVTAEIRGSSAEKEFWALCLLYVNERQKGLVFVDFSENLFAASSWSAYMGEFNNSQTYVMDTQNYTELLDKPNANLHQLFEMQLNDDRTSTARSKRQPQLTFKVTFGVLDEKMQSIMWNTYEEACKVTGMYSPQRQFHLRHEFYAHLMDSEVVKIMMFQGDEFIGLLMFTNNLDKTPWISKPFYERIYPEDFNRRALWNNICMMVKKSFMGKGVNKESLSFGFPFVTQFLGGRAFVDFSDTVTGGLAWSKYMSDYGDMIISVIDRRIYTQQILDFDSDLSTDFNFA